MPEYLAPGVYVEEIDTGSKPIEGVSTSTGGMVGVTERGPENVPILITSFGEFNRWFGGYLDPQIFVNPQGPIVFLPHAVDGFFTNGGKRVFVVRVIDDLASFASTVLHERDHAGADTALLFPVAAGAGNIIVIDNTSLAANDWIRIGDGSDAEYWQVNAVNAVNTVSLGLPSRSTHQAGAGVVHLAAPLPLTAAAANAIGAAGANAGSQDITMAAVVGLAAGGGELIRIGDGAAADRDYEYVVTTGVAGNILSLRTPLQFSHPNTHVVQVVDQSPAVLVPTNPTNLVPAIAPGDLTIEVLNTAGYGTIGNYVRIDTGLATDDVLRIGDPRSVTLSSAAYADYPAHSIVEPITFNPGAANTTMAAASAGTNVIAVASLAGLNAGDVLCIGNAGAADVEYHTILSIPNPPPPSGNVALVSPLQHNHPAATPVVQQQVIAIGQRHEVPRDPTIPPTALTLGTSRNGTLLYFADGTGYAVNTTIRVTVAGRAFYHRIQSVSGAALVAQGVTLAALDRPHVAGARVVGTLPLLEVQALDRGAWGNRLRVAVQDQDPPLLRTQIRDITPDFLHIRLNSISGVEVGTMLQRTAANGTFVGTPFKVINLDRQADNLLTLDSALPNTAAIGEPVRSMEFQINVLLLRQPDPAIPTRSSQLLDSESFRYLSMDNRHSRYVEKVIGTTWTFGSTIDDALPPQPLRLEDRRAQGESRYLRIFDVGKRVTGAGEPDNTLHSLRLGPELLMDILPDGRRRPARRALTRGSDAETQIDDTDYIGTDNQEPRLRTGLQSLRNEDEISIIACPGRTSQTLQNRMIDHCEELRYRFAILDAQQPPRDSLNDVQNQRQQYDTKYAALYHPWPLIPDPFPMNSAIVKDYPIPPSGHMMGIYARTDVERGVHKAPANEVTRGIIGLQRLLNKSEQDILNPYPVNINVIRDFRPNNRGIRVWGGRVITSDPDWKYVNVRRLLIFIEASIDRGLQWVVFEPNAEPLWARVNRTVSNFLTSVWRDGALEGTKPEEAYFVKVDRTTMTQTDIDNGKLIVLIGVAPVKPAEFVIIRIGLWTAHADS
jgi:phage tail sheath protein FI